MRNFEEENGGTFTFRQGLASTFCRKLLQTLICGKQSPTTKTCSSPRPLVFQSKFDRLIRLSDLLKLDDESDYEIEEEEEEEEVEEVEEVEDDDEEEEEGEPELASPATVLVVMEQEIKDVVRRVQSGEKKAVEDVRILAKDNMEIRDMFGMFGVIPMLVSMVDCSGEIRDQINVLYALLNVGVGHEMNKAAIANAGAIHTLITLLSQSPLLSPPPPPPPPPKLSEAIIANLLSLSALDANKPILALSCIIPILLTLLSSSSTTSLCKQDSIRTLLNLSLLSTTTHLTHLVPTIINLIGDPDINVYVLSILSNLVSTAEGRVAVSPHFDVLIDVLTWVDAPLCQEKAVYILMVISYKANHGGKAKMVDAGIIPTLLELILVGTNLAENCACRLLEILTMDKGKEWADMVDGKNHMDLTKEGEEENWVGETATVVKRLVGLSLKENMRRIVKRANLQVDFVQSMVSSRQ